MHLADGVGQLGAGEDVAEPPAGDAEGLGQAADGDGAVVHARERGHRDVLVGVVEDVLVDLVGDAERVELLAEPGDQLQLGAAEHLAAGIVRRVDDDRARPRREGGAELVGIDDEVGAVERDEDELRSAHRRVRDIVLVEGLEDDDFVALFDDREHGRHHGLGGAAGDGDLAVRLEVEAVEALRLGGDGVAQARRAPGDRVLVDVGVNRVDRGLLDEVGGGKVRVALGEVDGVVDHREAGHFADDRFAEDGGATGDVSAGLWLGHQVILQRDGCCDCPRSR